MLIKSLVIKKDYLTTVNEHATLEEALKILEDSGYRCVPILDDTGTIFRGNIYKMHIYRHKSQGKDMSLPVTYLLKNATKTIKVNSPFFKVFFTIKDLPYISVLDEENKFYGILTHSRLLDMLSDAWNIKTGSYVLTVLTDNSRGNLVKMAKAISKYSEIAGVMSLDASSAEVNDNFVRRILFTLPAGVTEDTMKLIVKRLEAKSYVVAEIEDLQAGMTIMSDENPGVFMSKPIDD
ncbi:MULTISPECIES: cyclic di-AMP binding protein CbpA [Lactobacillus]|uniref:CBS domain-containing protein n=1 Tax=Lactobacillus panisapium TaxID=2012495 RepID=A0ABX8WCV9_9LACO|nr:MULTISPECIES: cyclic di-AMP binding protein CbpA [Lactobacillus]MCO6531066.1 CBS domain-containing protein [Lactobacillus sp.]MCO6533493.1 CBS domain-containing protein [Lactobacillus sp.]MCO6534664.1 CBS domain-containing protein [Lactobacillus sp.]MCX8720547.1 CBS domain-containing protein [Lactobacillus sp. B4010]MCX8723362.1 CBS domain-containing protein [Lactobacillus sp. B4005]